MPRRFHSDNASTTESARQATSPALIRDDSQVDHAAPRWTTSGAPEGGATFESTDDPLARTVRTTYTGQEFDEELGLTDMQGRIFDQAVGRFMQPDPVAQAPYNTQGLNRYSYALNSPLNLVDPSGFDYVDPQTGIQNLDEVVITGTAPSTGTEHGHGQTNPAASDSRGSQGMENHGSPNGSASPTGNSANGRASDPTGGDNRGRPNGDESRGRPDASPVGSSPATGQGSIQSAQAQNGAGPSGDFSPGKAQALSGMDRFNHWLLYSDNWFTNIVQSDQKLANLQNYALGISTIALATIPGGMLLDEGTALAQAGKAEGVIQSLFGGAAVGAGTAGIGELGSEAINSHLDAGPSQAKATRAMAFGAVGGAVGGLIGWAGASSEALLGKATGVDAMVDKGFNAGISGALGVWGAAISHGNISVGAAGGVWSGLTNPNGGPENAVGIGIGIAGSF
jgi:RHS repeat-associated protein